MRVKCLWKQMLSDCFAGAGSVSCQLCWCKPRNGFSFTEISRYRWKQRL